MNIICPICKKSINVYAQYDSYGYVEYYYGNCSTDQCDENKIIEEFTHYSFNFLDTVNHLDMRTKEDLLNNKETSFEETFKLRNKPYLVIGEDHNEIIIAQSQKAIYCNNNLFYNGKFEVDKNKIINFIDKVLLLK